MGSTRTVFYVVSPVTLIRPELSLRPFHGLLHADGIAGDAQRIANGLGSESQATLRSTALENTEIIVAQAVGNGQAVVVEHL